MIPGLGQIKHKATLVMGCAQSRVLNNGSFVYNALNRNLGLGLTDGRILWLSCDIMLYTAQSDSFAQSQW